MSTVKNLIRSYDGFRLEIPELHLPDAGIAAMTGPSGSGKSSVVRVLLGLDSCEGLSWVIDGIDVAKLPAPKRNLGVVFQSFELFPHMTAEDNIRFAARARRLPANEIEPRLKKFIEILELGACAHRPAAVLSGGEKQRVALARALIGRPRFLFLDEPFSALDMELRHSARNLVGVVIKEENVPVLLITHDPADIDELGIPSVIKIRGGRIAKGDR